MTIATLLQRQLQQEATAAGGSGGSAATCLHLAHQRRMRHPSLRTREFFERWRKRQLLAALYLIAHQWLVNTSPFRVFSFCLYALVCPIAVLSCARLACLPSPSHSLAQYNYVAVAVALAWSLLPSEWIRKRTRPPPPLTHL